MKMSAIEFDCIVDNGLTVFIAQLVCLIGCVYAAPWVWVEFWVGLQQRKPNPEKTQPINPNPENSGLTQYIQIVIVVFMVVSQSESEGHSHLLIKPFLTV